MEFGGRTASILAKCRTLYEQGGLRSVVLVRNHAHTLPRAIEGMRRRGQLGEGVEVRWLMDAYPDGTEAAPPVAVTQEAEDGLEAAGWRRRGRWWVRGAAVGQVRRRYHEGALEMEEQLDPDGHRLSRSEYDVEGRLRRSLVWEGGEHHPRRRSITVATADRCMP